MIQKKILIFEPYTFSEIYGNLRYIMLIFKYIDRSKFEIIFVTPFENSFVEILKNGGVSCIVLSPPRFLSDYGGVILNSSLFRKFLVVFAILKYTISLSRLIIKEHVQVIQCHSIRSLLTIGLAAKLTRRPCIWYIKGELTNKILDRIGFFLANRIFFLNRTMRNVNYDTLVERYRKKISILKIGIDSAEVLAAGKRRRVDLKKELEIDEKNINICFLGTIAPYKGLKHLIKAIGKVTSNFPNTKVYIVGNHCIDEFQDYKTTLDRTIERENIRDYVVFTGWRADALDILALMDIYVLPSLSEGVPRSIVEAMMLGKPVVATRVGGIAELVRHGETGFLVKPMDSEELADSIIALAKEEGLRNKFGERARTLALSEYSIQDNIAGLEKAYVELIGMKAWRGKV